MANYMLANYMLAYIWMSTAQHTWSTATAALGGSRSAAGVFTGATAWLAASTGTKILLATAVVATAVVASSAPCDWQRTACSACLCDGSAWQRHTLLVAGRAPQRAHR
jgi:hypothetical protein